MKVVRRQVEFNVNARKRRRPVEGRNKTERRKGDYCVKAVNK